MKFKNWFCLLVMVMMVAALPALARADADRIQAQKIALEKTDVSLIQIITSLESNSDIRVVKVETEPFSLTQGPMCYDLLTVKEGTVTEYYVDVTSGKVLLKKDPLWGFFYFSAVNKAKALSQVKLAMVQAIGIAEKATGGKTVHVKVHRDSGIVFYQINMIVNDDLKRVLVDSYNGKVTDVPMGKKKHFNG
jgi:uncharacterized membrane protein YkoI